MKAGALYLAALLAAAQMAVAADLSTAFAQGQAMGTSGKAAAQSNITAGQAAGVVPNYTSSATESRYFSGGQGSLSGPAAGKVSGCATGVPNPDPYKRQECEAVNFLAKNPAQRQQFGIGKSDPLLAGAKPILANPAALAGSMDGSYSACSTQTVEQPAQYSTEVCNQYADMAQSACQKLLLVTCNAPTDGCDAGGIVPNSWAGDMSTSFTPDGAGNYILQFGTIADNYWGGWGAVYDRNLTFDIRDAGLITRFVLTRAVFDDWLMVKVNGTTIFVGPHGGDRLDVVQQCAWSEMSFNPETGALIAVCNWYYSVVQYCPTCFSSPELATNWNFGLNIDIRPYLKNGSNTIFMRTIVAGGGEGAIQMTTRQICPRNCTKNWNNGCATLEARAQ